MSFGIKVSRIKQINFNFGGNIWDAHEKMLEDLHGLNVSRKTAVQDDWKTRCVGVKSALPSKLNHIEKQNKVNTYQT